tara:strand:+ start:181 stop:648 length:468 start_codon:yes stop_codon:yes gene_type:complete
MAVGTVSGVDPQDNWQLISSVTASGTSVVFSSLTGYKDIWINGRSITKAANDYPFISVNSDTSVGNYGISGGSSGQRAGFLCASVSGTAPSAFGFKIYNIDQTIPHRVDCNFDGHEMSTPADGYFNPVAITSITVKTLNGTAYNGGTISIYGIPA